MSLCTSQRHEHGSPLFIAKLVLRAENTGNDLTKGHHLVLKQNKEHNIPFSKREQIHIFMNPTLSLGCHYLQLLPTVGEGRRKGEGIL